MNFFGPKNQAPVTQEELLAEGAVTVRDVIAPSALQVEYDYIQLGTYFLRTFFVYSYPRYLYTEWLSPVVNSDFSVNVSIFIYPVPTPETIKKLRNKSAQISATIMEDQYKGKVRDPLLETAEEDVEELRDSLQRGEAKLFKTSLYFTVIAKTKDELETISTSLENILGGTLVLTKPAIFQQEQGLNVSLPLGKDDILIAKNLDTGALSTIFPFASSDLSRNEGILYGINLHTNGLILFDRFKLENANSIVLAKSGSGKSYAVKLELLRYLMFGSEIIVIDPENEYEKLCEAVGGSYLTISANSESRVNPFDLPNFINADASEANDALRTNVVMLHGLFSIMLKGSMTPIEENMIDQAIIQTYASKGITNDPKTHTLEPPVMGDFINVLSSIKGAEQIVASLTRFSSGTYAGIFNQKSNVNLNSKFVVFSIRDLEEEIRPIAMFMILNYIWNKVKSEKKKRILAVDEAWILMKHKDSAQFLYSMAKRARKYYLGVTTIIQDVEDFLATKYGRAIVSNSSLTLLLKQHPSAIDLVAETFNLTQAEKYFLLNSEIGEGIFFAGQDHAGIHIASSYQEDLLVTTKPEEK